MPAPSANHPELVPDPARPEPELALRRWGLRGWWLGAAGVLVLAGVLRWAGAQSDLWFDELLNMAISHEFRWPWEVLWQRRDTNHYLLTAYFWALPLLEPEWVYRLPSLVAGVLSVALAGVIAGREGRAAALITMALWAVSFGMVQYSSEARGYALMGFFVLASLELALRYDERPWWVWLIGIWAAGVLGMLSHLVFVYALGGLAAWAAVRGWRVGGLKGAGRRVGVMYGVPLGWVGLMWVVDIRQMEQAGGPIYPVGVILARALGLLVGVGDGHNWGWVSAGLGLVGLVAALWAVVRWGRDLWVLFAVSVILLPAAHQVALIGQKHFFTVRYLWVGLVLGLVWLGVALGRLWQRGRWGRLLAMGIVAGLAAVNLWRAGYLLEVGRGQYHQAAMHILAYTTRPEITVSSSHDTRIWLVLEYYFYKIHGNKKATYCIQPKYTGQTEWRILEDGEKYAGPENVVAWSHTVPYLRSAVYRAGPLAGYGWVLYHRMSDTTAEERAEAGISSLPPANAPATQP